MEDGRRPGGACFSEGAYVGGLPRSHVMPLWVYILTNRSGTLCTGVTNDVARRLAEHRAGSGFTSRYDIDRLVYVEEHARPADAIAREKQIKGWRREKKVALIHAANPRRTDLARGNDA